MKLFITNYLEVKLYKSKTVSGHFKFKVVGYKLLIIFSMYNPYSHTQIIGDKIFFY